MGELREGGRLQILAGRLRQVAPAGDGFAVKLTRRGHVEAEAVEVGAIVNCTGPAGHLPSIPDPLLQSLLAQGLAGTDALGLGLATSPDYRLEGPLAGRLFHVGPFLRGRFWEATAVPELREHAARVAETVRADLAGR